MTGRLAGEAQKKFKHYKEVSDICRENGIKSAHLKYIDITHYIEKIYTSFSEDHTQKMQRECMNNVAGDLFKCVQNLWHECVERKLFVFSEKIKEFKTFHKKHSRKISEMESAKNPDHYDSLIKRFSENKEKLTLKQLPRIDFSSEDWSPYILDIKKLYMSIEVSHKEILDVLSRAKKEKNDKGANARSKIRFWGWVIGGFATVAVAALGGMLENIKW